MGSEMCIRDRYVKGVNANSLPVCGIARRVDIGIGSWGAKIDIIVASLNDRKLYLGIDFLYMVKAITVPCTSTLFIMHNG